MDAAKHQPPDLPAQLARGYRLVTLREAPAPVIDTLTNLHTDAVVEYQADPAAAKHLAESPDQAALVLVANTLLNSDAALTR